MEIKLIRIEYFKGFSALQQKSFLEDKVQSTEVILMYPELKAAEKKINLKFLRIALAIVTREILPVLYRQLGRVHT